MEPVAPVRPDYSGSPRRAGQNMTPTPRLARVDSSPPPRENSNTPIQPDFRVSVTGLKRVSTE